MPRKPRKDALVALVAQLCLTPCNPMDCSPPGSSVHGLLQARILEWVVIPISTGSSQPAIEPGSPALQADSFPSELQGNERIEACKVHITVPGTE